MLVPSVVYLITMLASQTRNTAPMVGRLVQEVDEEPYG